MNRVVKQIIVSKEFEKIAQSHLDSDNGEEYAHENAPFIETMTVDFGKGIEADIKVCFERETTYVDPVLFHNGCEVSVGEVSYELLGEYEFEYEGIEYVVEVVIEEEV